MKIPSLQFISQTTLKTFQRFPLVVLFTLTATVLSVVMVEYDLKDTLLYVNYLLTLILGAVLFINITLYKECFLVNQPNKINTLYGIAALFLIGVYFSFPNASKNYNEHIPYIRYTIFAITLHLGISFIPFLKNQQSDTFWYYNKTLFIRYITGFIYSNFIIIGLFLALFSINNLFNINIHENLYFDIVIVTYGIFNTLYFLAGIPKNINQNSAIATAPKSLKILSQYILLPLLCIYLAILFSYTAKILFSGIWPKGIVSNLIIGLAILSFFYVLFVYPYSKQKENAWMLVFNKFLYTSLAILSLILFTAILMRVSNYGITIQRYTIICFGIWILLNSIYLIFKPNHIQLIPISLALILLICSFGPWSIFSVSENSQVNRLKSILEQNHILENGKIKNEIKWNYDDQDNHTENEHLLTPKLREEVRSIIRYLDDYHGFESIQPWFTSNLANRVKTEKQNKNHYVNETEVYLTAMGISSFSYENMNNPPNYTTYTATEQPYTNVSGYDYLLDFDLDQWKTKEQFFLNKEKINLKIRKNLLILQYQNKIKSISLAQIHWTFQKNKSLNKNRVPTEQLSVSTDFNGMQWKFLINRIEFEVNKNELKIYQVHGNLLINK